MRHRVEHRPRGRPGDLPADARRPRPARRGRPRPGPRAGCSPAPSRLRIVDRDRAVQPWTSADGRWLLCYNGEIFNHRELRAQLPAWATPSAPRATPRWCSQAFLRVGRGRGDPPPGRVRLRGRRTGHRPRLPGPRPARGQAAVLVPSPRLPARRVRGQGARRARRPGRTRCRPGTTAGPSPTGRSGCAPYVDLLAARRGPAADRRPGRGRRSSSGRAQRQHPDAGRHRPDRRASSCPAGWTAR